VILDRWRVSSIYRSHRLSRSATESTFSGQGTTILTVHMPGGNHVLCRDGLVLTSTFLGKRECWDLGTSGSGPHVLMSL
jgi:hypothetical protein